MTKEETQAIKKDLKAAFPGTKFSIKMIKRNSTMSIDILESFEEFELNGKEHGYWAVVKKVEDLTRNKYGSRIMADYCNLRLTVIF